jgi:hypothetical protein
MDIRTALHTRGHRQRDVAKRLNVKDSTVSRWFAWARDNATGVPIPPEALPVLVEMSGIPAADLRPDLARLFPAAQS